MEPGATVTARARADDLPQHAPAVADIVATGPGEGRRVAEVLPLHAGQLPAVELAAGVVCWREVSGDTAGSDPERALEVLLVHRPRYDDWSFPKGKVEPGETLPECAVREAAEETGVRVRLGIPLPTLRYALTDGRPKEVTYWAGQALSGRRGPQRAQEVDEVAWVAVPAARKRLTHDGDVALLDVLVGTAAERRLRTRPLLVVRHATARPRQAWTHADADRPLVAAGRRQALALTSLLQCWSPEYLLSSPWRRCTETLAPYAAASGARVRIKGGLSEGGWHRDPRKAARHTQRLARTRPAQRTVHAPAGARRGRRGTRAGGDGRRAARPARREPLPRAGGGARRPCRTAAGRPAGVVAVERHAPHR